MKICLRSGESHQDRNCAGDGGDYMSNMDLPPSSSDKSESEDQSDAGDIDAHTPAEPTIAKPHPVQLPSELETQTAALTGGNDNVFSIGQSSPNQHAAATTQRHDSAALQGDILGLQRQGSSELLRTSDMHHADSAISDGARLLTQTNLRT